MALNGSLTLSLEYLAPDDFDWSVLFPGTSELLLSPTIQESQLPFEPNVTFNSSAGAITSEVDLLANVKQEEQRETDLPTNAMQNPKRQKKSTTLIETSSGTREENIKAEIQAFEIELDTLRSSSNTLDKLELRHEKNRLAAAISRRKRDLREIESTSRLAELQEQIARLTSENEALKARNVELEAELARPNNKESAAISLTIPQTTLLLQYPRTSPQNSPTKQQPSVHRASITPHPF